MKKILFLLLALVAGQSAWATTKTVTYTITSVERNSSLNYEVVFTRSGDTPFDDTAPTTCTITIPESALSTSGGAGGFSLQMADGFVLRGSWAAGSNVVFVGHNFYAQSTSGISYILKCNNSNYYVMHVTMGRDDGTDKILDTDYNSEWNFFHQYPPSAYARFGQISITYSDAPALNIFEPDGENAYKIKSKQDLLHLANYVNVGHNDCSGLTFRQTKDITCDDTYVPIGYYASSSDYADFSGTYDGQGYTLSGINVGTAYGGNDMFIGLFSRIKSATIQNVVLSNSTFTGSVGVAGIAAYNSGGTVINCRVENTVTIQAGINSASRMGSFVGYNVGMYSKVIGCVSAATVSCNGKRNCEDFGGIVGDMSSSVIKNCLFTGTIVDGSYSNFKGGIAGHGNIVNNFSELSNNYYTSGNFGGLNGSDVDGARLARTVTLGEGVILSGDETDYDISGLTAIGDDYFALRQGSTIYSGEGQTLTLSYSGELPAGYAPVYSVNGNAIEGNTFEMPAADVTVTATTTAIDYTITLPTDLEHATITSDKATAHVGDTVTLTVTPNEEYVIESVTVMNGDNEVEITEGENNTYTFEMPAADVTVSVEIQRLRYTFNSTTGELKLIYGEFNKDNKWGSEVQPDSVKSVTATSEVSFTGDCSELFYNFKNCESMDLNSVNTSEMTNCYRMFYNCWNLTSLDLSNWNTANVTSMNQMFNGCSGLTSLDLSNFNTGNVTDMCSMFSSCSSLTSLDLSGFNTGNVTNMSSMFWICSALTSLNLSNFDTGNVTYMSAMFEGCSALTSIDLSGWNTDNVTAMNYMFYDCQALTTLDLSCFDTGKVEYMEGMFYYCKNLTTIYAGSGWSTESVEESDWMFKDCTKLVGGMGTTYDANHIDAEYARLDGPNCPGYFTSSLPRYTFDSETGVLALNWGEFNKDNKWSYELSTASVTSVTATSYVSFTGDCSRLFSGFDHCVNMDLNSVNTSEMTNCNSMFYWCENLDTLDLSGWDTGNVTSMNQMFSGCNGLTSLDVSGWNTANVTDMCRMFFDCNNLTSLDLSGWDVGNVTDMRSMFSYCNSLTTVDLSGWNTANVTSMEYMFYYCTSLTTLDLSSFDTGNVTDMSKMLDNCHALTTIDLSSFDTSNVIYMYNMFYNSMNLTTIYAGTGWSTESVQGSDWMFAYCASLVGGMGTTYDEHHSDAEYARIDGGPNCPGYFTDKNPVVVVTGDVDGDGYVTTVDITAIYNYLLNGDETFLSTSDVDGDGFITTTDITVIYNILLGN
ncbi:MAG: BspA family leucine-rich repeat surface protein [Muribaculaceae bacterium]|nr:BspA family leucine-rich repeat surface protein [Muribaculaceae bacterium]